MEPGSTKTDVNKTIKISTEEHSYRLPLQSDEELTLPSFSRDSNLLLDQVMNAENFPYFNETWMFGQQGAEGKIDAPELLSNINTLTNPNNRKRKIDL